MQVMAKNHFEVPSGGLTQTCCFSIIKINIFEKMTISPARDERDIDFDCIYTVFESERVPSTRCDEDQ